MEDAVIPTFLRDSFDTFIANCNKEYSRLVTQYQSDITHKISNDDYTERYGEIEDCEEVQLFKKEMPERWLIHKIECRADKYPEDARAKGNHRLQQTIIDTVIIDNFGQCYMSQLDINYVRNDPYPTYVEKRTINQTFCFTRTNYVALPNALINLIKNEYKTKYYKTSIPYSHTDYINPTSITDGDFIKLIVEVAKHYSDRFTKYKSLYESDKLKEYQECVEKETEHKKIISKLKDDIEILTAKIESQEKIITEKTEMNNILTQEAGKNVAKIAELQKQINQQVHFIYNYQKHIKELETQHHSWRETTRSLNVKREKELVEKNDKYADTIVKLNNEIKSLKRQLADAISTKN
uniref:Uncharacterized protein n=1 Tax=viral metagenome TaxID=1070528 RepID=A0A6C0ED25_9ZZZZ